MNAPRHNVATQAAMLAGLQAAHIQAASGAESDADAAPPLVAQVEQVEQSVQAACQAYVAACTLDVSCVKPGNVSVQSPGHGMQAQDFIASAQASAGPISDAALGVGARILGAVQATQRAVGMNTNLGIVLLAAPLLHAQCHRQPGQDLRTALAATLAALNRDDALLAYRAIRLAAPAGLGASARHDVRHAPAVSLLEAMLESAARDSIARQYASNYADVWAIGLPALRRARQRFGREEAAVAAVHLGFLAAFADSHVLRKQGYGQAEQLRREGAACQAAMQGCADWGEALGLLDAFDRRLKCRGINPGTSADLTVAVLLAESLQAVVCNDAKPEAVQAGGRKLGGGGPQ